MTIFNIKKYGLVLTGREFGKNITAVIVKESKAPFTLDFSGVISLGSSFGDELLPALAKLQVGPLIIINANQVVQTCISKIKEDSKIEVLVS